MLYCSAEIIRRALRTDCATRKRVPPRRPPQRTAGSTFAGADHRAWRNALRSGAFVTS